MKFDDRIKINIEELVETRDALADGGEINDLLDTAHSKITLMQSIIRDDVKSLGYTELGKILSEINDSQRGLTNNFEEISKNLDDYIISRTDGINIKNESQYVIVDKEIKDVNQKLRGISSDIKSTLNSHIPKVGGLVTLDSDKRHIVEEINTRIEATAQIQNTKAIVIEDMIDESKELCVTIEEWYEDDYNEAKAIGLEVAKIAAVAGLTIVSPAGMALIVGGIAAVKYYEDGYSGGEALAIGTVKGGLAYGGEIVGSKITKKGGEVLAKGASSVSNYANDLVGKINLPTNVIRDRLESISSKAYSYDILVQVMQTTERDITIPGNEYNSIMKHISNEIVAEREYKGTFITHDFAAMYDEFMATSSSKIDELLNSAKYSKENIKAFMNREIEIKVGSNKFRKTSLSEFSNGVVNGAIDDIANELTDNIIESTQATFNLDELDIADFHTELVSQFKQSIVSIATQF